MPRTMQTSTLTRTPRPQKFKIHPSSPKTQTDSAPPVERAQAIDSPKDQLDVSQHRSTEAGLHYGVSGATLSGLAAGAVTVGLFGAGAGSAGLAILGLALGVGVAVGVVGGVANAIRGAREAKQANPSLLKRAENAVHYGVSGAVLGTAATVSAMASAIPGPGAMAAFIVGPKVGMVTGAINALRGWNLKA